MPATSTIYRPTDADYGVVSAGAGLFDRSDRGKLAVTGRDAAEFLDSLLSNDIAGLEPGSGCEAALLTHKGRLLAQVRVLRSASEHWLDTDRPALQALFDALAQFRIGYEAELHKRTLQQAVVSVVGPRAADVVGESPERLEHSNRQVTLGGTPVLLARTDLGIDVICEAHAVAMVWAELKLSGAVEVGEDAVECVRIEQGRPRFGVEIDDATMPQEAGIHERAVSYTKGCYVGQETVARLYWKGKPNRHLRGLRLTGPATREATLHQDGNEVGRLGSVAISPALGPIGLALVRREAGPGDVLVVNAGPVEAEVVETPF